MRGDRTPLRAIPARACRQHGPFQGRNEKTRDPGRRPVERKLFVRSPGRQYLDKSRLVGVEKMAHSVLLCSRQGGVFSRRQLAWFGIRDGINHDDPATADVQQVTVASPGFLTKAPGAAIGFTPLLTTSQRSGLLTVDQIRTPDPARILAEFKSDGTPRVSAARVRGVLKSAFAAPPPQEGGQKRPGAFPGHKAQSDGPTSLVVVADSDLLADRFWVRITDFFGQQTATRFANNGAFVANLIGSLSGSDALTGLRARGDTNHTFTLVATMQSDAKARFRQTQQTLQAHLAETEKQLRTLRTEGAETEKAMPDAVIALEQRVAIDAVRQDLLETRHKLRAVRLELNRDISALATEMRIFTIVIVPALPTLLAIGMGIPQRRRRARTSL